MSNSIIDTILAEAELELEKDANDANGAPESANNDSGNGDVLSQANAFLQEIEQFKAQIGQNVAGNAPIEQGGEEVIDPNADPNAQVDPNAQAAGGGAMIQTPGGSIIKVAGLMKLAAQKMKLNLNEVR